MTTRVELLAEYDDARTELDRAYLEAFMMRRRARLEERPVTPEEEAAAKLRTGEAERRVSRAEYACKAARVHPVRGNCVQYLERHKERLRVERLAA
ncbi:MULTISPECIES: hypothetical protein [Streptomyces]|uniref:hypothetical protein n=1 Tax=Streptomyces TaxID=1883 RepID=UPI0036D18D5A